jgi:polyhydroxybutyrate depolymerase
MTKKTSGLVVILLACWLSAACSESTGGVDASDDGYGAENVAPDGDIGGGGDADGAIPDDAGGGDNEPVTLTPGEHRLTVTGLERRYLVHVPPSFAPGAPPLAVLVLHGGGGAAEQMVETGMEEFGDRDGFAVIYPEGVPQPLNPKNHNWNAGNCDGVIGENCGGPAFDRGIDDVAYFRAVLGELRAGGIKRVFVSGISNGGMMAHRVGCALADEVHGIAAIAGALALPSAENGTIVYCEPGRPLDVLIIHATNDENLPYDGGSGACSSAGRSYPSVDYALGEWRRFNNCAATETEVYRKGIVVCVEWACAAGTATRLCRIDPPAGSEIGGHSWPGSDRVCNSGCPCTPTQDLDASAMIAEFALR